MVSQCRTFIVMWPESALYLCHCSSNKFLTPRVVFRTRTLTVQSVIRTAPLPAPLRTPSTDRRVQWTSSFPFIWVTSAPVFLFSADYPPAWLSFLHLVCLSLSRSDKCDRRSPARDKSGDHARYGGLSHLSYSHLSYSVTPITLSLWNCSPSFTVLVAHTLVILDV